MTKGIITDAVSNGCLMSAVNSSESTKSAMNTQRINLGRVIITAFSSNIASVMPMDGISTNAGLTRIKDFNMRHVKVFESLSLDKMSTMEVMIGSIDIDVVPAPVIVRIW